MEQVKYFKPDVGKTYRNRSGGTFRCVAAGADSTAYMQNTVTGWQFLAHGCQMFSNGTIEWDHSTGGRFLKTPDEYRQASKELTFDDILQTAYDEFRLGSGTLGEMEDILMQVPYLSDAELGRIMRTKIYQTVSLEHFEDHNTTFYGYLKDGNPALIEQITAAQHGENTMDRCLSRATERAARMNSQNGQNRGSPVIQHRGRGE